LQRLTRRNRPQKGFEVLAGRDAEECVLENLAMFGLGGPASARRARLQRRHNSVIEVPDNQLPHDSNAITIAIVDAPPTLGVRPS
jgi:hypothetical protein